jgi:integrase
MAIKKVKFEQDEEIIFDDAVIYRRGDYWQFRMWLRKEHKYARFSLQTKNKSTAIDKAKLHYHELMAAELAGRRYFSITTKDGVEMYLAQRLKEVGTRITAGRHATIKTHLEHWLDFIHRDKKLKELERTDCEDYFLKRHKPNKTTSISQSTIENEQSSINAMMSWLFKHKETHIDAFDFPKLKRKDFGDLALKRPIFTLQELDRLSKEIAKYVLEPANDKNDKNNSTKAICGYFHGLAMLTGMRRGELQQLRWSNISLKDSVSQLRTRKGKIIDNVFLITVPGAISKVRRTRQFMVEDERNLLGLMYLGAKRINYQGLPDKITKAEVFLDKNKTEIHAALGDDLIFTLDGEHQITARALYFHFDNIVARAKIEDVEDRGIVPYSFRHSYITHKVNSGLSFVTISETCGTSVGEIERTYYRTTKEKMLANALVDHDVDDELVKPKSQR